MIHYPLFDYGALPRTGTAWFTQACAIAGLGEQGRAKVHEFPEGPKDKLRVTSVRHPADWLVSYFHVIGRTSFGIAELNVFAQLNFESFTDFIKSYLKQCPGAIERAMDAFQADVVQRLEDQPRALIRLLNVLDHPFNMPRVIIHNTRINVGRFPRPYWQPNLYDQVLDAEASLMERFDYDSRSYYYPSPTW